MKGFRASALCALVCALALFLGGCATTSGTTVPNDAAATVAATAPTTTLREAQSTVSTLSIHERIQKEQQLTSTTGGSTSSEEALLATARAEYQAINTATMTGTITRSALRDLLDQLGEDISRLSERGSNPQEGLSDKGAEDLSLLMAVVAAYEDGYTIMGQPADAKGYILVQKNGVDQFNGAMEMVNKYWLSTSSVMDPTTFETAAVYIDTGCFDTIWAYADHVGYPLVAGGG